jgi:hypothetical protein
MENKQDFVIENGVLQKYNGPGGDVTIPAGVTEIGQSAFYGCTGLTSVTIPAGVTEIGQSAFYGCTGLTSVTIPESVTEISGYAFYGCTGLTSVTIPESVTEIGNKAFEGCTGLTSVTIPAGVKEIGESAFEDCTGLTSVTIPEGVKEIRDLAFYGCTGLTSVTIPKGITTIHKSVFEDSCPAIIAPHIPVAGFDAADKPGACCGFAKLYLDGAALDEEIKAGYLKYIKGQKKRLYPTAIKHEELLRLMLAEKMLARKDIDPLLEECDRQNNIAAKAAVLDYAGKSLKPVDPEKEMEREFAAMERSAKNLEEFQATGVMKVGEAKKLFRYQKREEGGLAITGYKGADTAVVIPRAIGKNQVTEIGWYAFKGCRSLTSVTIPESVTEIGYGAFSDCTCLTRVTIPAGVTKIWDNTFKDCTGLTSVTIPESVTEIGYNVFTNCRRLVIHAPAGSYAEQYAKKNSVKFEML